MKHVRTFTKDLKDEDFGGWRCTETRHNTPQQLISIRSRFLYQSRTHLLHLHSFIDWTLQWHLFLRGKQKNSFPSRFPLLRSGFVLAHWLPIEWLFAGSQQQSNCLKDFTRTLSTASEDPNRTKPKPRERPVTGSLFNVQSTTSPYLPK